MRIRIIKEKVEGYRPKKIAAPGWGYFNTLSRAAERPFIKVVKGEKGYLSAPLYGVSPTEFLIPLDLAEEINNEEEKV